jgi:hypothetical protein
MSSSTNFSMESERWTRALRSFPWKHFITLTFPPAILAKNSDKFVGPAFRNYSRKLKDRKISHYWTVEARMDGTHVHFHLLISEWVDIYDLRDAWARTLDVKPHLLPNSAFHSSPVRDNSTDFLLTYMTKFMLLPWREMMRARYDFEELSGVRGKDILDLYESPEMNAGNLKDDPRFALMASLADAEKQPGSRDFLELQNWLNLPKK